MTVKKDSTINDFFPSRFMKASDIVNGSQVLTIMDINLEVIGEENENKLM